MTVLDIVEKHPETENIFRDYDAIVGKCVLCACLFDSIEDIATNHNLDLKSFLYKINSSIIQ